MIRLKDKNPYTMAADVYSFGVVMYEMLSGQLPYHGMFPDQIMFMVGMGMLKPDMNRMSVVAFRVACAQGIVGNAGSRTWHNWISITTVLSKISLLRRSV